MPFFVHRTLRGEQRLDTVERERLRIGRGTDADLRLDDRGVELVHAEIELASDGSLTLHNKARAGGTSVAGDWLVPDEQRPLADDERIEIGPYEIRVDLVPGSASSPAPPPVLHVQRLDEDRDLAEAGSYTSFRASTKTLLALAEREMARQRAASEAGGNDSSTGHSTGQSSPGQSSPGQSSRQVTERTVLGTLAPPEPSEARTLIARFVPPPPPSHWTATPPPPPPSTPPDSTPPDSTPTAAPDTPAPDPPTVDEPPVPAPAPAPPRARRPRVETRRIDYLGAYRLPTGPAKVVLSLALLGLCAAVATAIVGRGDIGATFSPGPMGGAHAGVVFQGCSSCHAGFLGVRDSRCQECHRTTAPHQESLAAVAAAVSPGAAAHSDTFAGEPACIHCHTEHRGGDLLRLVDEGVCVDCHSALDAQIPGSVFANRITHIAVDHPELAIYAGDGRRLRLDQPGARDADPGGLRGFDHRWHIARLPGDLVLDCADCHDLDEAREIVPLSFEASCQRCHQLAFDPRFGTLQAPHAEPVEVADFLAGRYVRSRDVLARLSGSERSALGSGSLSREQKLTRVASLVGRRLARNQCAKCHHLELPPGVSSASFTLDQLTVRPVRITETWFPHARFFHAPHLDLMECSDCHGLVRESTETTDILMPTIETCRPCHAGAQTAAGPAPAEDHRGRAACISCHGYHADPIELARSAIFDRPASDGTPPDESPRGDPS